MTSFLGVDVLTLAAFAYAFASAFTSAFAAFAFAFTSAFAAFAATRSLTWRRAGNV